MNPTPMFFGPGPLPLFGWLHRPEVHAQQPAKAGVVLCNPWGREEVSAHHSIRQWAAHLSEAGWPALRFDYVGEGDSGGDPLVDGGLDAWIASVHAAIDALKLHAGVSHVCLLGLRLGASLACLAASGRDDVSGVMAVAPVVKGRGFVRELTALQAAANLASHASPPVAGVFQSGGFTMSEANLAAVSAIDLTQATQAPAGHLLVLDRDDLAPSKAWIKALQDLGCTVDAQVQPGYQGMMSDPHHAVAPQTMIDATLAWLGGLAASTSPERLATAVEGCTENGTGDGALDGAGSSPSGRAPHGAATFDITLGGQSAEVLEAALCVPGTPAFGIVSVPAAEEAKSGHAILLLNAGSTRHIGPSRMSVDLAREWAAQGHVVLRMDLAGVGDSAPRAGKPVNLTYPHEAMEDVAAAIDFLQRRYKVDHVHACGLCSGAYHALKAARDGMPLASLALINPLIFFNAEGLSLDDDLGLSVQKVHSASAAYKQSLVSTDKWLKLIKGQVHVGVLIEVIAKRVRMLLAGRCRDAARAVRWPLKDDLGTELRRLVKQGVKIRFFFAEDDPGVAMMRDQAGSVLAALQRGSRFGVDLVPGADHVFTDLVLRRDLLRRLREDMASSVQAASSPQSH